MSEIISGYHDTAQTIDPTTASVIIIGTVLASGSFFGDGSAYAPLYAAVYATGPGSFTVTNPGIIDNAGTSAAQTAVGIFIGGAATLHNHGSVYGHSEGVLAFGGTIINKGFIAGSYNAIRLATPGSINNSGTIAVLTEQNSFSSAPGAIELTEGGSVHNSGTIISKNAGIVAINGPANIYNSGLIDGDGGTFIFSDTPLISAGISLLKGGTVSNHGTILGTGPGVEASALAKVINYGYIASTGTGFGIGVDLRGGGDLINYGTIENSTDFPAIFVMGGGSVDNLGVVGGYIGAYFLFGNGTFTNSGTVDVAAQAVRSYGDISVVVANSGLLKASDSSFYYYQGSYVGAGVDLSGGGKISNSGTIVGGGAGVIAYGATSIFNRGVIESTGTGAVSVINPGVGILTLDAAGIDLLAAGGTINNTSTGLISGVEGIISTGGTATTKIINAGTITGTGGVAVDINDTAIQLRDDPGAVFNGKVIDHNNDGTLELAAALDHGTLFGLGSDFVGFSNIVVEAGANWTLTGSSEIVGGQVFSDYGTASGLSIQSGGLESVFRGGVASGTAVDHGGLQLDLGGKANATTVNDGGSAIVLLGGAADQMQVRSGGLAVFAAGGKAIDNTVSYGGGEVVLLGGSTTGNVLDGGQEILSFGGTAVSTTVDSHGMLIVDYGGTSDSTTLSGGTEMLESGATIKGDVSFQANHGTLAIEGTYLPKNLITGFNANGTIGDVIVLAGFSYASTDMATLGSNNVLTLSLDGTIKTLHFDPSQNFTNRDFVVQTNSHDQVVVVDPAIGQASGGMIFVGESADNTSPSLARILGELANAKSALQYFPAATAIASVALQNAITMVTHGAGPGLHDASDSLQTHNSQITPIPHFWI